MLLQAVTRCLQSIVRARGFNMVHSTQQDFAFLYTFTNNRNTHSEVKTAGETFILKLYLAKNSPSLDESRLIAYKRAIGRSSLSSTFQLASLPPTSAAAKQHSFRTYLAVQEWMGNTLPPTDWGWRSQEGTLEPLETDIAIAPDTLLNMVSCGCKADGCSYIHVVARNLDSFALGCVVNVLVDHQILLERLETSCGISSLPLLWIKSYLSDRTQMIVSGEARQDFLGSYLFGCPQSSVLGPLLFILYTADIPTLFSKYLATGHLFADDVQAYVHGPPSSQLLLASKIELLSNDLNSWMSSNRLSLNSTKTQLIWFGTPQQLLKLDHALLSDRFPHFTFHTTVRDLGVTLDSALTFSQHISNLTRSSYFQLRHLRTIRKAVSVPIFTSIVHAFVCSRIDYCNSLLIGLPKTRLSPLQTVLNAAARLIARLPLLPYLLLHQGTSPLASNLYSH